MIPHFSALSPTASAAVKALADQTAELDGVAPLNEAAALALADPGAGVQHWLLGPADALQGYAQLDERDRSVQLFVAPAFRRQGLGRALAEQVRADATPHSWWSFGDLPAARALAEDLDLKVIRGLLKMSLPIADLDQDAAVQRYHHQLPAELGLDHFHAADLDRLVTVNAAAFANHPEQGALTADDFRARMASSWYRDEDLLVARDASGVLVGYHWTKLEVIDGELIGEVYVLGVDPGLAGGGVGSALLDAGIMQMRARGAVRIDLYVEAANTRVVELYQRSGFSTTHTDVAYGSNDGGVDG